MIDFSGAAPSAQYLATLGGYLDQFGTGVTVAKIALFQNNYTPSEATVIGDLIEATVTGYTAGGEDFDGALFLTPHIVPDGGAEDLQGTVNEWVLDGSIVPQTIYGCYWTDNAGTTLYGAYRFPTPLVVDRAGFVLDLESGFRLAPASIVPGADVQSS